jgi:hypothetical protein
MSSATTPTKSSARCPSLFYWTRGDGEFESIRETVKSGADLERHAASPHQGQPLHHRGDDDPSPVRRCRQVRKLHLNPDGRLASQGQGAEEGRNAIIEALPDEVFIYDAETFRLTYANENARRADAPKS